MNDRRRKRDKHNPVNPSLMTNIYPIPGATKFKALPPRSTPAHWRDVEGTVTLSNMNLKCKWLLQPGQLPRYAEYKRFCELVCCYVALSKGYNEVHIRSVMHDTTNATKGIPRHLLKPQEKDWHITANFGVGSASPQTAHVYVSPLNLWHAEKEDVRSGTLGLWRPTYSPAEPVVEWYDIDKASEFAKKR